MDKSLEGLGYFPNWHKAQGNIAVDPLLNSRVWMEQYFEAQFVDFFDKGLRYVEHTSPYQRQIPDFIGESSNHLKKHFFNRIDEWLVKIDMCKFGLPLFLEKSELLI